MVSIIVCGLLLCTSIMVITQGRDILTNVEHKDVNTRMFFYLCLSAMVNNICNSGMMVMKMGPAYDCLAAVSWCTGIAFMGSTVYLLAYLLDTDKKRTQLYTSIILYLGIIFFIVDTLLKGCIDHIGIVSEGRIVPIFSLIVMSVICVLYLYFIFSMVYSYRNRRNKRRERVIFRLIMAVCVITLIGTLTEIMIQLHGLLNIPFSSLFMVIVAWCLKRAYLCHAMLKVRKEDYDEVLEANSHEPVVICDDEGTVVYINKCEAIAVVEEKEPVIGKKLVELFEFSKNETEHLFTAHTGVFSVTGIYRTTGRRCNLTIQNVYDTYGEVFTNIVTIYRLEQVNTSDSNAKGTKDVKEIQNTNEALSVTKGAKILLVDDSPSALAMLEESMKPYQVEIKKAYSGKEAVELIQDDPHYDMIFMDHMMPEMDGIEAAKQIRAMEGDYFKQVPIVFCTATNIEENLSEFLKVRFNDFLAKPISIKELGDILTRWLWNRLTLNERQEENVKEVIHMSTRLNIQGIDEELAAKYIGDNRAMYFTLLNTFVTDMKEMIVELEKNYEHFDRMRFRIITHAMSGSSKEIGAVELAQMAEQLEQACMVEDNQFISEHIRDFLDNFRELINSIENYMKTTVTSI